MSNRVVSLDRTLVNAVSQNAADNDWDLVDEISRLKIGQVPVDPSEGIAPQTPPKSKIHGGVSEASPLETSSEASVDSSSENHHGSHSRGPSTDTTASSTRDSAENHTLLTSALQGLAGGGGNSAELKERPHSFSGGLSTADLRRLQLAGNGEEHEAPETPASTQVPNQQWSNNTQYNGGDQPTYPSLSSNRAAAPAYGQRRSDENPIRVEYNNQQRNFVPLAQPNPMPAQPQYMQPGRPGPPPSGPNMTYRQMPRSFPQPQPQPQQTHIPGAAQAYPHHASHVSLGNGQHMYDMMQQQHENHHPAVARVQQQHNVFRHTHSASDPTIRDAALLVSNMHAYQAQAQGQMFGQGMSGMPQMQMYPTANHFYAPQQEQYSHADLAAAQAMASRLQPQYSGSYGAAANASIRPDGSLASPMSAGDSQTSNNGPSANNRKLGLYKTELCRSWEEKGTCRYGTKCQFAHGEDELRKVSRHPKYKTEICRTFWVSGSCPYGKRCCFIHTELPVAGGVLSENTTPPPHTDGRSRSMSVNSDPDANVSLLARISAQRNQDAVNASNTGTPVDMSPPSAGGSYHFNSRPPTGSLRVDTSVDNSGTKQNKSAYPSFAGKGVVHTSSEQNTIKSPVPVTAGPDLGRHNNSRVEIVGYNNQQRLNRTNNTNNPNVRHSFSGPDDLNFTLPAAHDGSTSTTNSNANNNGTSNAAPRGGHARSGSAGDWGSFGRSTSHLAGPSPYPNATSPESKGNPSPWSSAIGTRLHETSTAWA